MNTTLLLNKTRKEVELAKTQATADAKAAQLARQLVRAAKVKQKQTRKLSKMAKKSAARAEDKSEESSEALESAQAKLKKLQKRIKKERRKNKPARIVRRSKHGQKAPSKPKLARSNRGLLRSRPKAKPEKTPTVPTPAESPVQSRQRAKAAAPGARGALEASPKTVSGKPVRLGSTVAPAAKPVPSASEKLGGLKPLQAADFESLMPLEKPAND